MSDQPTPDSLPLHPADRAAQEGAKLEAKILGLLRRAKGAEACCARLRMALRRLVAASGQWEKCVLEDRCRDPECDTCRGDDEYLDALAAARATLEPR